MRSAAITLSKNVLLANGLLLQTQRTDRSILCPHLLRREMPRRITLIGYRIQDCLILLVRYRAFLKKLTVEPSVSPRKVVHITERLLKLSFIYFG